MIAYSRPRLPPIPRESCHPGRLSDSPHQNRPARDNLTVLWLFSSGEGPSVSLDVQLAISPESMSDWAAWELLCHVIPRNVKPPCWRSYYLRKTAVSYRWRRRRKAYRMWLCIVGLNSVDNKECLCRVTVVSETIGHIEPDWLLLYRVGWRDRSSCGGSWCTSCPKALCAFAILATWATAPDVTNWRLSDTVYRSRPTQKRHRRALRLSDAGHASSVTTVWFAWFARFHDLDQQWSQRANPSPPGSVLGK